MWLMEQPWLIAGTGLMLSLGFLGGLLQTGRYGLLYASLGTFLVTIALVLVERSVITPREQVRATLHVIAGDLVRNDHDAVLAHLSSGRPQLREDAEQNLRLVEIREVNIKRNLKIELVNVRGEDIAEAKFNATISARLRGDVLNERRHLPYFFTVRFRLEDGHWRIRDYELDDPRAGIGR